jgi:hypothetical protein
MVTEHKDIGNLAFSGLLLSIKQNSNQENLLRKTFKRIPAT